jgi:hypothetical protein
MGRRGACDLLLITVPPILITVDLRHGYLPRGPVHGVRPELLRLNIVRERCVRSVKVSRMVCRA